jgi:hypothetical protein
MHVEHALIGVTGAFPAGDYQTGKTTVKAEETEIPRFGLP